MLLTQTTNENQDPSLCEVESSTNTKQKQRVLEGTVTRILYSSGTWGLILLQRPNGTEAKAKGNILPLPTQCEVRLEGEWVEDNRNPGEEIFDAEKIEIEKATTRKGLIEKLSELPHVGRQRAICIIETFGEDPKELIRLLKDEPELVAKRISGLSVERSRIIAAEIEASAFGQFAVRDIELLKYLPRWIVNKALKRWPGPPETKQSALELLREDPYRLVEISGVGFKRADRAAMDVGIPQSDERRVDAALEYLLGHVCQQEGHTWVSLDQAAHWAQKEKLESIDKRKLAAAVERSLHQRRISKHDHQLSTFILSACEKMVARRARELTHVFQECELVDLTQEYGLNKEQAEAVRLAQTSRFLIITGGPGTGKTYTLQAILKALHQEIQPAYMGDQPLRLCAPTGKAARRMAEMTNREASTLHYMLRYKGDVDAFEFGPGNYLPAKMIVCDEASMLDARLAGQLFGAINPMGDTRLILVGDVDQLPSVGPGKVLHDLIESQAVPVVRLTRIMRQAEDSAIARNSHALIHGEELQLNNNRFTDFKFFEVEEKEIKREEREAIAKELIWAHATAREMFGLSVEETQVLSPQKAGEIGTLQLNKELRELLNPPHPSKNELEVKGQRRVLREGDRVIQTKNDYELFVFNGEMGTVTEIEPADPEQSNQRGAAIVKMDDGRYVRFPGGATQHLRTAYAITVHKSQGSEWPCVIIPVSTSHAKMLTRRLLYTAITRGKKLVVLVGTQKALRLARKNIQDAQRQTRLLTILTEGNQ